MSEEKNKKSNSEQGQAKKQRELLVMAA